MILVQADDIRSVAMLALKKAGAPEDHAAEQVELLLEADLRGVPSHGMLRLERVVRRIANGVIAPEAKGVHFWRGESYLEVDGERGLGPVIANAALDAAMARAAVTGVAVAAIRNSNHVGMLGWYAERVALRGMTAIALSTSEALVHPWGARKAMLGTNPIAIGVPTDGSPFMMDTATSVVSMGEIHDYANREESIPIHWALDSDGNQTTDAVAAKKGSIAPFGQAKGYALGLGFELLVSSLAGAAIGRDVVGTLDDTNVCNKGDLFIVMNGPRRDLQVYLEELRSLEPATGFSEVLIPGERGRAARYKRLSDGVPLPEHVWSRVQELADVN